MSPLPGVSIHSIKGCKRLSPKACAWIRWISPEQLRSSGRSRGHHNKKRMPLRHIHWSLEFFIEVSKDLGVFFVKYDFHSHDLFGFAWETEHIWMVSRFVATMPVALTSDPWHVSYDHQNVINQWFVSDEMWWQSIYVSLSLYIYIHICHAYRSLVHFVFTKIWWITFGLDSHSCTANGPFAPPCGLQSDSNSYCTWLCIPLTKWKLSEIIPAGNRYQCFIPYICTYTYITLIHKLIFQLCLAGYSPFHVISFWQKNKSPTWPTNLPN